MVSEEERSGLRSAGIGLWMVVLYPSFGGVLSEKWWCYIRVLVVLYPRIGGVISEKRGNCRVGEGAKMPVLSTAPAIVKICWRCP